MSKFGVLLKLYSKWAIAIFAVSLLVLVGFNFLSKPIYQTAASVYVQKKVPAFDDHNSVLSGSTDLTDHVQLIKSNLVMSRVAERLATRFPKHAKLSAGSLGSRVRVINSKETRILEFGFQDSDPDYVAATLDITLQEYNKALKRITRDMKIKSLEVLQQRLADLRKEREDAEAQLETYSVESGIMDASIKNNEMVKASVTYSQKLEDINAQLVAAQQEIKQISDYIGLSAQDVQRLSGISDDPKIRDWQDALGKAQAELSDLKATFTDKYSGVGEKKREIAQLQNLIANRIATVYGKPINPETLKFSKLDSSLGEKMLNLNVEYIGLMGQQQYYQNLLSSLPTQFGELATQSRNLARLKNQISFLIEEEKKLNAKLQDERWTEDIKSNVESFMVVNPPVQPKRGDYVYPLKLKSAFTYAIFASMFLSVFSVGLMEYFNPRLIDLSAMPALASVRLSGRNVREEDILTVYQNIALQQRKQTFKTLSLFHLCESNNRHQLACPYDAAEFAQSLSKICAQRGMKTLLIEYTQGCCTKDGVENKIQLAQVSDNTLYQDKDNKLLHYLCAKESQVNFFDPYVLKLIPNVEQYDLVLLNLTLTQNQLIDQLLCEVSDATLIGISQSKTAPVALKHFQHLAHQHSVRLLGSIVFP